MTDKKDIKAYGKGRLYNPETGEYFVRFNRDGEATVTDEQAKIIKKYHKQVYFEGQKPPKPKGNVKNTAKPKSFADVNKTGFKIPVR
jgi:hypothetical protein